MLHVILHQLCQGGKLFPTIQVVVVSCVLDFNVGDGSISPVTNRKRKHEHLQKCCQDQNCTLHISHVSVCSFAALESHAGAYLGFILVLSKLKSKLLLEPETYREMKTITETKMLAHLQKEMLSD